MGDVKVYEETAVKTIGGRIKMTEFRNLGEFYRGLNIGESLMPR
jgi:hypothetical protein